MAANGSPQHSGAPGERAPDIITALLPDDSVLIRNGHAVVHVDARTRGIHVRVRATRRSPQGVLVASYPLVAAERVQLRRDADGRYALALVLRSGRCLTLGAARSRDVAMVTAWGIADLTRCKLDLPGDGDVDLPGEVGAAFARRAHPPAAMDRDAPAAGPGSRGEPSARPAELEVLRSTAELMPVARRVLVFE